MRVHVGACAAGQQQQQPLWQLVAGHTHSKHACTISSTHMQVSRCMRSHCSSKA
jgi:hypothetical protein